jgi:hypothetical protein
LDGASDGVGECDAIGDLTVQAARSMVTRIKTPAPRPVTKTSLAGWLRAPDNGGAMPDSVRLTQGELGLILDALGDAVFYRDARSHVLRGAVRRRGGASDAGDEHRIKARAYEELARRLGKLRRTS